nr:hypothetical protein [Ardenticatena sp.]
MRTGGRLLLAYSRSATSSSGRIGHRQPFDRALTEAQRRLRIMPIGIAAAGAWRYAFVSDLPHLPEQARLFTAATKAAPRDRE